MIALAECEATVRHADPDRYLAALFAPGRTRPLLYALYAFNHELARIGETARDPFAAEIRLQWWREAVADARKGRPAAHPVAVGLAELLLSDNVLAADLDALIDARVVETFPAPFSTLEAMESHAKATSARLMQIALRAINGAHEATESVDDAGIAYGLTGMLRSFRFHALRGKIIIPDNLLVQQNLTTADIVGGKHSAKLKRVFDQIGKRAMDHFQRTRQNGVPAFAIPAALPASLVPAYLSRFRNLDPFHDGTDILHLRKQLIMFRAALVGRL